MFTKRTIHLLVALCIAVGSILSPYHLKNVKGASMSSSYAPKNLAISNKYGTLDITFDAADMALPNEAAWAFLFNS